MAKTKIVVDYDAESDSLAMHYAQSHSSHSFELGDIIVDFSKNKVVGLELLNASRLLETLTKQEVTKSMLKSIKFGSFVARSAGNNIVISFELQLLEKTIENSIAIPRADKVALVDS